MKILIRSNCKALIKLDNGALLPPGFILFSRLFDPRKIEPTFGMTTYPSSAASIAYHRKKSRSDASDIQGVQKQVRRSLDERSRSVCILSITRCERQDRSDDGDVRICV
jgi:hypothetical protein